MLKGMVLCICFCLLIGMLILLIWSQRHPPEDSDPWEEGKRWWKFIYPTAYRLHLFWRDQLGIFCPEEKIRKLQQTYMGKSRKELEIVYDCQRIGGILLILILTMGLVMLSILGEKGKGLLQGSYYLARGEPGMGARQVDLEVEAGGREKEVSIRVPERQYLREELEGKFAEAKEYVKKSFLGENSSPDQITYPLRLVKQFPGTPIKVNWKLDSNGYIHSDGSLNNSKLQEETQIMLTAVLSYGEEREKLPLECILYPKKRTEEELFWEDWDQELREQEEVSAQESSLQLPKEIQGQILTYHQRETFLWIKLLLSGLVLCLLFPFLMDYQTEQRVIKRERELQREYPEIVERFILLIGAGLTIRGAWYRITEDYKNRHQQGDYPASFLYEEMLVTRYDMENGQSEALAYAAFGRRLSLLPYMKFSTLLVQNLRKGSGDLLKRMEGEAEDALRERREQAKKLGEEAGTKLLIPMMLMLILVFAMIMIAAFQNM